MKNIKRTSKQLIMELDELYRSLLENAPCPITAINPDTSLKYANPAFEKLTGFSLPEIIGRQAPYPWWPEETWAKRLPDLKKLMGGANRKIEQTIQNKNGERSLVQLNIVRVADKGTFKYHLAYWLDITERKRAEEVLIESEEKYRTLVEDALVGIMNVDLTGRITYVNNTIVHESGYSREELIGKNAFRLGLITREMIKVLRKRMKEKLTGQPPGLLQLQFKCKDGRWIWLQIRGKVIRKHNIPVGIQIIGEEITERKQAEERLRESEEKLRRILETVSDGLSVTDLSGVITEVNDAILRLGRFSSKDDIIGKNAFESIDFPDRERALTDMLELAQQGALGRSEYHLLRADGSSYPAEISANVLKDAAGNPAGFVSIIRDITERKRTEEALRESEEFSNSLLENSPHSIIVVNPDTSIRYINPAFEKLNGWTLDEVVGIKVPYPWWPDEDKEVLTAGFLDAMKRRVGKAEGIAQKKNKERYWFELSWAPIMRDGELQYLLINAIDITERKLAEEALRESEERYRSFVQNFNGIAYRGNINFEPEFFHGSVEKMTGYTEQDFMEGKIKWDHIIHKDDLPECLKKVKERIQHKPRAAETEFRIVRRDGSIRWIHEIFQTIFNDSGEVIGTQGIQHDITERKQAEEALRESEEKLRLMFQASADGIAITDMNGVIIDCNQSAVNMYGASSREEILGKSCLEFIDQLDKERVAADLQRITTGELLQNTAYIMHRVDGSRYYGEVSPRVIKDASGNPFGIIAIVRDVTERKQAEERVRHLNLTLRSIRNINQLITREKDRSKLLRNVCKNLVDTQSCFYAWVALFNESLKLLEYAQSNIGKDFLPLLKKLQGGVLPVCAQDALRQSEVVVIKDTYTNCSECPLSRKTNSQGRLSVRLEYEGKTYGILCAAVPLHVTSDNNELALFREVADDIAFALHDMELEEERKKSEEALRESEEKFSKAFRSSPDSVAITTFKDGRFVDVNDSYIRLTGYTREEVIGHTTRELGFWPELEERERKIQKLKGYGRISNEEVNMRMKSGEIRTLLFSAEFIDIGGELCVISVATDITARKQAEEALRESEEKFSRAFRSSPDMIIITTLKDGRYIEVNDSFTRITGYSREEIIGKTATELHTWAKPEQRDRMIQMLLEKGHIRNEEFVARSKSGKLQILSISAEVIDIGCEPCIISVSTDITERKKAEKALRESEEKFSKAFRSSPDMVAIATKDTRFIEVNDSFTHVSGYTRKELIGHSTTELNLWANKNDLRRMIDIMREKGRIKNEECQFCLKSGEIRTILFSAEPIEIGGERCIISVATDITERKQAQARQREAENLKELDRLRTELLANISHELRTPLSSIKGFATVLLDYEDKLTRHEKREYLETIDKNTDRLVELIEQLLDMSRLGAGLLSIEKSPTSISQLFQEVLAEVQVRAPAHRFILDLPARLPRAHIDARRIHQVLDNLTNNAVKHSRAGTEITIRARKKGDEILVAVIDQGTGIPKNVLPRVFERLFSSGKSHIVGTSGAGLGLSICKGMVEAHGGRIWIESEEGKGTTCFFTLPVYQRPGNDHGQKR